jgi:outer membrane protein assembly factor BamB
MEKKIAGIVFGLLIFFAPFADISTQTTTSEIPRDGTPDWWPIYGHDIRHTGFSSSLAPETNTTLFSVQLISSPSNTTVLSGPTVVNGKLYLSSSGVLGSELMCADAFNGSLLWNVSLGNDVYFSPTISDGKAYQFSENTTGNLSTFLSCYDAENGSSIWNFPLPNTDVILSPPVVSEGKLFFGTYSEKKLYCLYSTNGTELWSVVTNHSFGGIQASPAVADGKLYATATNSSTGSSYLYCYNTTDGSLIWTFSTTKGPGRAPTLMNNSVFVGAGDTMYCLDAVGNGNGTTSILWHSTVNGSVSSSSLAYGNIYFSSTNRTIYSVNASTGASVWGYLINGTPTAPILADNKLYVASYETIENLSYSNGYVYCLDALGDENGTTNVIWQSMLPDHNVVGTAQPAIALSTIWIATNNNWVYAFSDNLPPLQPGTPTGPTQGYANVQYTFSATTTDPNADNISYMWSWGDGSSSNWSEYVPSGSVINASHIWDAPGNYSVMVRARDVLGLVTNWSNGLFVVIVTLYPLSVEAGGPYEGKVGDLISFNGLCTGGAPPYHWHWDFGDGNISEVQNTTHIYQMAGEFPITLTVTDALFQNASDTSTATISPLPQPDLVIRNITGGFGVNAVIQNIGNADATNVSWNITLKGGFLLLGNRTAARITRIQPGQNVSVKSSLIIGLGKSTITVAATCNERVSTEKATYGFIILIFVFGVE